jgi:hypothetical protein
MRVTRDFFGQKLEGDEAISHYRILEKVGGVAVGWV